MRFVRVLLLSLLIVANTLVHIVPLLLVAVLKGAVPVRRWRRALNPWLAAIAESWIGVNNGLWRRFVSTRMRIDDAAGLRRARNYLVLANHQSWVDILVLQKVLNRRIPLMRFFLKRQLIWVPLLGLAWWALDFPFMGRYTARQIARDPNLARRDREATRRACEKFSEVPVAIMNFVEGTRFTAAKHAAQGSPFEHLLKPKAGGVGYVLGALGGNLHAILDVTIAYPAGVPTLADLIANRIPEIAVDLVEREIPPEFIATDYSADRAFRARFQQWLNGLWQAKDKVLDAQLKRGEADADERAAA